MSQHSPNYRGKGKLTARSKATNPPMHESSESVMTPQLTASVMWADTMTTCSLTRTCTSMRWATRSWTRLTSMPSNTGEKPRRRKIERTNLGGPTVARSMTWSVLLSCISFMVTTIWLWWTQQRTQEFCRLETDQRRRGRFIGNLVWQGPTSLLSKTLWVLQTLFNSRPLCSMIQVLPSHSTATLILDSSSHRRKAALLSIRILLLKQKLNRTRIYNSKKVPFH